MPEDTNTPNQPNTPPNEPANTPPDERQKEIERLLSENQNLRKTNKEASERLNALETSLTEMKKAGHKSNGEYQKLWEESEKQNEVLKGKYQTTVEAFKGTLTSQKVKEEALKNGFKPDLVDLLDTMHFEEIDTVIDENNRFVVKGAEQAVKRLKATRQSLFAEPKAPSFNPGGPGAPPSKPGSLEEAKARYQAALANRNKNPVEFNKAHTEYQSAIFANKRAKV